MKELLRFQTNEFELVIWCADISKRQQAYRHTLSKRASNPPANFPFICSIPASDIEIKTPSAIELSETNTGSLMKLVAPVFFENIQYHFEWMFIGEKTTISDAEIVHRSGRFVDGFRFAAARASIPSRVTGSLLTGNDIGWISFKLRCRHGKNRIDDVSFAFEVLPAKLDLNSDLPVMYKAIDNSFPLWRFSLSEITQFDVSRGSNRGEFMPMWLANFSRLQQKFESALKVIENAPHTILQPQTRKILDEKIKGNVSDRIARKIREGVISGKPYRKYTIQRRKLTADTSENRFVKMTVEKCNCNLLLLERRLRKANQIPNRQRLSNSFFEELTQWRKPLKRFLRNGFVQEAGRFEGLSGQETALQRKTGYSTVYRCWQELKYYLDAFADESRISLKSIAEIYEIWCFLELRRILVEELGFIESTSSKSVLVQKEFLEYELLNGFRGVFNFERADGAIAKLAHGPRFSKGSKDIKSYLVTQEPDIFLEIEFTIKDTQRLVWLFDAKYRIRGSERFERSVADADIDFVPDDALNQMHRYRDALIRTVEVEAGYLNLKSRPVVGAFALYPGYFNQAIEQNPYQIPIDEVGIGAFSLLPSNTDNSGSLWLTEFLKTQIGNHHSGHSYVQETARIPYEGMRQVLYRDLLMTAAVARARGRSRTYLEKFERGTARWYHIPQKRFTEKRYGNHIAYEIRYIGLAVNSTIPNSLCIERIWPVNNVKLLPRHSISEDQAGRASENAELYYLFELGKSLAMLSPVTGIQPTSFRSSIKMTTLKSLEQEKDFNNVIAVYPDFIDDN